MNGELGIELNAEGGMRNAETRGQKTEDRELNAELGMRKPVTRGQKTNLFIENREASIEYLLLNVQRPATRRQRTDDRKQTRDPYF